MVNLTLRRFECFDTASGFDGLLVSTGSTTDGFADSTDSTHRYSTTDLRKVKSPLKTTNGIRRLSLILGGAIGSSKCLLSDSQLSFRVHNVPIDFVKAPVQLVQ